MVLGLTHSAAPRGDSRLDKVEALREILAQDPGNSFARYGVAMELAGRGETEAALAEFETLLTANPSYTAGYFMSAQTLAAVGRRDQAMEQLKRGIRCAQGEGNSHAAGEMQAMLDELDR
jgi:thioredoxin-like negative regulator of GroEL